MHAPVLTLSVRAFFFQIHFDIGLNDFSGSLPTELGRLVALEYGFNVEPRDGTRGAALLRLNDAAIPTEVAALSSAVRRRVLESAPGAYDDGHMWRASPPQEWRSALSEERARLSPALARRIDRSPRLK